MSERNRNIATVLLVLAALFATAVVRNINNKKANALLDFDEAKNSGLPVLLEIGSHTCIPCKQMMPILIELKNEYAEDFAVAFVDTAFDENIEEEYDITLIPTQVFLDEKGEELFRHMGFFPKKDIMSKWKELGLEISEK